MSYEYLTPVLVIWNPSNYLRWSVKCCAQWSNKAVIRKVWLFGDMRCLSESEIQCVCRAVMQRGSSFSSVYHVVSVQTKWDAGNSYSITSRTASVLLVPRLLLLLHMLCYNTTNTTTGTTTAVHSLLVLLMLQLWNRSLWYKCVFWINCVNCPISDQANELANRLWANRSG